MSQFFEVVALEVVTYCCIDGGLVACESLEELRESPIFLRDRVFDFKIRVGATKWSTRWKKKWRRRRFWK